MKVLSERYAEDFLEKEGFKVVERTFSRSKYGLRKALLKVGFPFVLKASGRRLFSKGESSRVNKDIKNYSCAIEEFRQLKKVNGADGVLIQKKINGKEFYVSVRRDGKTKCSISFGFHVLRENGEKEVVLNIYSDSGKNIKKIVEEGDKIGKISRKEKKSLEDFIFRLLKFLKKDKSLSEITTSSLIVDGKNATVVDAKVVFS